MNNREQLILADSRIDIGTEPTVRLFRNNVGVFLRQYSMEPVRCGLCPGSGDLIGWRSIWISPDMVGHQIAQFVSAECKAPYAYATADQRQFMKVVRDMGGVAGIFRSPAELRSLTLGKYANGTKGTGSETVR